MSIMTKCWKGKGYNENATLMQYEYADGSIHYTFYPRVGLPGNPTEAEAREIVKRWNLEEVK
jgi:hypothetical protein